MVGGMYGESHIKQILGYLSFINNYNEPVQVWLN